MHKAHSHLASNVASKSKEVGVMMTISFDGDDDDGDDWTCAHYLPLVQLEMYSPTGSRERI